MATSHRLPPSLATASVWARRWAGRSVGLEEVLLRAAMETSGNPVNAGFDVLSGLMLGPGSDSAGGLVGAYGPSGRVPALLLTGGDLVCLSLLHPEQQLLPPGWQRDLAEGRAFERGCNWMLRHGLSPSVGVRRLLNWQQINDLRRDRPAIQNIFERALNLGVLVADEGRDHPEVLRLRRRAANLRWKGERGEAERVEAQADLAGDRRRRMARQRAGRLMLNSRLREL